MSALFPSELCRFIRPDLYPVVDRAVIGRNEPYEEIRQACSEAWKSGGVQHRALRSVVQDATEAKLPPTYSFSTKIRDQCLMGMKTRARTA